MFTYNYYIKMLQLLMENNYFIVPFCQHKEKMSHIAILRHDVDISLEKAVEMGDIEKDLGVKSTYFIMLTSDFYNPFTRKNSQFIYDLIQSGHEVGLHFDETKYGSNLCDEKLRKKILEEIMIMEKMLGVSINCVSMHIPNKRLFEHDLQLKRPDGRVIKYAYDKKYVKDIKYVSDSMMRWREPILVECELKVGAYNALQILIHPVWYGHNEEKANEIIKNMYNMKIKDLKSYLKLIYPLFQYQ